MVRPRLRRPRGRREWRHEHHIHLAGGFSMFAPFEPTWPDGRCPPGSFEPEWPTPEEVEDMRACWAERREEIIAEFGPTHGRPLWGEAIFELGVPLKEARDYCAEHRRKQGCLD